MTATNQQCPHCGADITLPDRGGNPENDCYEWDCGSYTDYKGVVRDTDCYERELTALRSENARLKQRLEEAFVVKPLEWGWLLPTTAKAFPDHGLSYEVWVDAEGVWRWTWKGERRVHIVKGGAETAMQAAQDHYVARISDGLIPASSPDATAGTADESEGV